MEGGKNKSAYVIRKIDPANSMIIVCKSCDPLTFLAFHQMVNNSGY